MVMEQRILLIDDEEISNFLAKKLIERVRVNCHVDVANNGQQGLDLINESNALHQPLPDFIFLDLNMPVLNGFEFMEAFNQLVIPLKNKNKIKIFIISSSMDRLDSEKAKQLGAAGFISKPLTMQLVNSILGE
jgi:CheY-like chemotaxis protein